MEILIIRHAESQHNVNKSKGLNSQITGCGLRQATELALFLKEAFPNLNEWTGIVSPYLRTLQTASLVSFFNDVKFKVDPLISEYRNGPSGYTDGKGITIPNLHESEPEEFKLEVETAQDLLNRMLEFKSSLKEDGKYIVVSHGTPVETLYNILNGNHRVLPWSRQILNTSVTWFKDGRCEWFAKHVNSGEDPRKRPNYLKNAK
jgi:broad specificity phosphatase PhoE